MKTAADATSAGRPPASQSLLHALDLSSDLERVERLVDEVRREVDALLERSMSTFQVGAAARSYPRLARAIMCLCAERFGVTLDQILGRRRPTRIVIPRHTAMCLCHDLLPLSMSSLGALFGRDHGAIGNARDQMHDLMETDPRYKATYDALRRDAMQVIAPKPEPPPTHTSTLTA